MHRSKFDPICSVNEISLGLLRKAHILTRQNNGARALLKNKSNFWVCLYTRHVSKRDGVLLKNIYIYLSNQSSKSTLISTAIFLDKPSNLSFLSNIS